MYIQLKNPMPSGTSSTFELQIKGKCPEGGRYKAVCYVAYQPYDKLVNVASFQKEYRRADNVYAEFHALRIYNKLVAILGTRCHVTVQYDVLEARDHGPLSITLGG